jgi:hypothetical protein
MNVLSSTGTNDESLLTPSIATALKDDCLMNAEGLNSPERN